MQLALRFWRRILKLSIDVFLICCFFPPLRKGVALHLNRLEFPLHRDVLCQVWLNLAQWFWRRRQKHEKFTTTTWRTTDKFWSEKLRWANKNISDILGLGVIQLVASNLWQALWRYRSLLLLEIWFRLAFPHFPRFHLLEPLLDHTPHLHCN